MICKHCGAQNQEDARFCQFCSSPLTGAGSQWGASGRQYAVRTLFGDMMNRKTPGTVMLLVAFIALCISTVIDILALAMRESSSGHGVGTATATWVFLLLFQIAAAALLAFRLDLINVMAGSVGIEGLCTILLYAVFMKYLDLIDGPKAVAALFMVLLILGICAKILFICLNAFMKEDFRFPTFVISVSYSGAAILFTTIIFIVSLVSGEPLYRDEMHKFFFEHLGLGFGFASYLIAMISIGLVSFCLYWGFLGTKTKFSVSSAYRRVGAGEPFYQRAAIQPDAGAALRCITGAYRGQVTPLSGEVILGSDQDSVSVFVPGAGVSRQHCRIQYDVSQNCYYIMDLSSNGTYVNGQRIPSGAYTACARGSVVSLADQGQQYQLL